MKTIHVVGGGTQNRQLCQATADACQRRVVAGPVEATAIGNVIVQAVAAGAVGSIAEVRDCGLYFPPLITYDVRPPNGRRRLNGLRDLPKLDDEPAPVTTPTQRRTSLAWTTMRTNGRCLSAANRQRAGQDNGFEVSGVVRYHCEVVNNGDRRDH